MLPAYSLPYTVDENNDVIFMYNPVKAKEEKKKQQEEQIRKKELLLANLQGDFHILMNNSYNIIT